AGNVATIVDFQAGQDTIWLSAAVFSAAGGLGGLAPNAFHIGAAADDADTRLLYTASTGALSYDADGTGLKAAAQFASLKPGLALSAGDFQI
ncbi:hypothetical protein KZZ04_19235, partial [Pseudoalteromonas sp. CR1]|uniref:hypothetical protein n=1 Tax=Pseudoalteromonas sp. CR1 TaxID=2861964 RepID=UPI001C5D68BB